jgi:hypothetical protein
MSCAPQQPLGEGSQQARDQEVPLGYGSSGETRAKREREVREKRARMLSRTLAGLAGRLAREPGSLRLRVIVSMARGVIQQLVMLGGVGVRQLESLLLVIATRELWVTVQRSLWKAYDYGADNAGVRRVSLLRRICEMGENRTVRLWALREMPAALADSRQLWEIALPVLVTCRRDIDKEVAQVASEILTPVTTAEASWTRDLLVASIDSSADREVLLFAIPVTERFAGSADVRRAIDALFHCYEDHLDKEVRAAIEGILRAHKRDHPIEYRDAEAEYARRAKSWIDRQILEKVAERDGEQR